MTTPNQDLALLLSEFSREDSDWLQDRNLPEQTYAFYADKTYVPRLQYWYARRHLVQALLDDKYEELVNAKFSDVDMGFQQAALLLKGLWEAANTEILRLEAVARAVRPPAIGVMCTRAPERAYGCIDPNDSRFRGDPLKRQNRPI